MPLGSAACAKVAGVASMRTVLRLQAEFLNLATP
jgi:hypothetical protein